MMRNKPHCPRCGRATAHEIEPGFYFCKNCKGYYDSKPDEGGDYSDRNPAARIERDENQRQKRQVRRGG